jgi:hypothetical protein
VLVDQRAIRSIGCGVVNQDVETPKAFQGEINTPPRGVLVGGMRRKTDCTHYSCGGSICCILSASSHHDVDAQL